MKQENLFKKLGPILKELCDQYEFLSKNPSEINDLELELFLANVYFLSDHIQIIKKLNARHESLAFKQISNNASITQTETMAPRPLDTKPKAIVEKIIPNALENKEIPKEKTVEKAVIRTIDEEKIKPAAQKEELFKSEPASSTFEFTLDKTADSNKFDPEKNKTANKSLSEEKQRILEQKLKAKQTSIPLMDDEEDEIGPEPFLISLPKENDVKKTQVAYKLTESEKPEIIKPNKPTLNDMHANKNITPNVNLSSSAAVKDLRHAISLNDKLLYIKDLFNGYNLAYAEAIDLANKLPNFEAADTFFQKNYAVKNNWADKQATVDKFYKLLNQRFKT